MLATKRGLGACCGPGESGNRPGFSEAAALEGVEGCLVAGAEVDARGVDGGTPLCILQPGTATIPPSLEPYSTPAQMRPLRNNKGNTPWDYAQDNETLARSLRSIWTCQQGGG